MEEKKYRIKLDLAKLTNAFVHEVQGRTRTVQCVCIPINDNHIFKSERGGLYLDLQATPLKKLMYGQTHLVKPMVGSENWKAMSEDERNAIPIVGNMTPTNPDNTEKPQTATERYNGDNNSGGYVSNNYNSNSQEDDDMPF